MLLAKFIYCVCLKKNIMVTQMWLLRFQLCAVVNRVAVPHLRLRHPTGNPECRVSSRSQTEPNLSATTSRINSRIRWRHHDRRSIRIETRHRQNPLLFSTFVTSQSQTSQIFRRQLHAFTHPPAPPRSPFNSHRNATSPKRYKGNRANSAQRECFFQIREHSMLPQQRIVFIVKFASVSS